MKPIAPSFQPIPTTLRLALPTSDPAKLARQLARTPPLVRRKPKYEVVEWTSPSPTHKPGPDATPSETPPNIAPDDTATGSLEPCFTTRVERTTWPVRQRDGSLIDVVLNIGNISAGGQSAPVCELELVLMAGHPVALFEVAQKIAPTLAVLPTPLSLTERGAALSRGTLDAPVKAKPTPLKNNVPVPVAAGHMLREMLGQFTVNLQALRTSEDPEVVHQARVGWRRFKSAQRLFRSMLPVELQPSWEPLEPLLGFLGTLRDLDVALTETLPQWYDAYTAGDIRRQENWETVTQALRKTAHLQRKSVRYALEAPEVGVALLAALRWIEGLLDTRATGEPSGNKPVTLRRWARHRTDRLHKQLQAATKDIGHMESQHRIRIMAKRLRYGTEALQAVLPKRRAQRWIQKSTRLQTVLGFTRDTIRAAELVAEANTDPRLVEFLRGVAAGDQLRLSSTPR